MTETTNLQLKVFQYTHQEPQEMPIPVFARTEQSQDHKKEGRGPIIRDKYPCKFY